MVRAAILNVPVSITKLDEAMLPLRPEELMRSTSPVAMITVVPL